LVAERKFPHPERERSDGAAPDRLKSEIDDRIRHLPGRDFSRFVSIHVPVPRLVFGANQLPGGLTFWDYTTLHAHQDFAGDQDGVHAMSVGLGLRSSIGRYFSTRLDYGWQLQRLAGLSRGQFGFVSATLSY
jgi:hypothetical protein